MEAAGADVFDAFIHHGADLRDFGDGVVGDVEAHALSRHQGDILFDEARFGFGQDAHEIGFGQGAQFDADGQAALQFGQQVRRLGHVERAAGDEQDMIRFDGAIFGGDSRAFDQGQQVALHAFAADLAAARVLAGGDFVDLIEENDAVFLGEFDGLALNGVFIDQLVGLFRQQRRVSLGHFERLGLRPSAHLAEQFG